MTANELVEAATKARERAYAGYSGFAVGAALLCSTGEVFLGCNIENVSYGLTMCAERVAIGSAIQAGQRDFVSIAIVADSSRPIVPCGACRQILAEFNSDLAVITATTSGLQDETSLSVLFPRSRDGILE